MMNGTNSTGYEGWAFVESMGHRRRVGFVREVEMFGGKLLRIDIPIAGGEEITEFYGCASIYALRPCSESIARKSASLYGDPRPICPLDYRIENRSDDVPHEDPAWDDEGSPV